MNADRLTQRYRAAFARQRRRERIWEALFGLFLAALLCGLIGALCGLAAGR